MVVGKDSSKAEGRLLQLPGVKKYFNNISTDRERDDFKRHMRKYINMWLPDCPFEVSTTNRYTITTHEAATTARRSIKAGETIKHLSGNLVAMTPDEEKDMDLTRRDFSVVLSSRKKTPSLFLGPARFSNHDCNANARLVTRGSEGMIIVAARNISVGDEITVNYGTDYFGEDNCECLCFSCEQAARGGWACRDESEDESEQDTPSGATDLAATTPRSRRGKRGHQSEQEAVVEETHSTNPIKKRKLASDQNFLASGSGKSKTQGSIMKTGRYCSNVIHNGLQVKEEHLSTKLISNSSKLMTSKAEGMRRKIQSANGNTHAITQTATRTPLSNKAGKSQGEVSAVKNETVIPQPPSREAQMLLSLFSKARANNVGRVQKFGFFQARLVPTPLKMMSHGSHTSSSSSPTRSIFDSQSRQDSSPDTTPSASESVDSSQESPSDSNPTSSLSPSPSASPLTSLSSELSSVPPNIDVGEQISTIKKRGRPRKANPGDSRVPKKDSVHARVRSTPGENTLLKQTLLTRSQSNSTPRKPAVLRSIESAMSSSSEDEEASDDELPTNRMPGDYTRTRLLLAVTTSRWVECRTCDTCWVQDNAYHTRKECPRCERHSKLYGYQWPKTENAKGEFEERVMDHRTVHRFIPREEEIQEKKRGRGVEAAGESSSRAESVEHEGEETVARGSRKMRGSRLALA